MAKEQVGYHTGLVVMAKDSPSQEYVRISSIYTHEWHDFAPKMTHLTIDRLQRLMARPKKMS